MHLKSSSRCLSPVSKIFLDLFLKDGQCLLCLGLNGTYLLPHSLCPTQCVSEAVFRSTTPRLGNTSTWAGSAGRRLKQEKAVHFLDEQEAELRRLHVSWLLTLRTFNSTPDLQPMERDATYSVVSPLGYFSLETHSIHRRRCLSSHLSDSEPSQVTN